MNTPKDSKAGYWLLVGLALMLGTPVVVGHMIMNSAQASQDESVSVHAEVVE